LKRGKEGSGDDREFSFRDVLPALCLHSRANRLGAMLLLSNPNAAARGVLAQHTQHCLPTAKTASDQTQAVDQQVLTCSCHQLCCYAHLAVCARDCQRRDVAVNRVSGVLFPVKEAAAAALSAAARQLTFDQGCVRHCGAAGAGVREDRHRAHILAST
jgi:hypothetical protein